MNENPSFPTPHTPHPTPYFQVRRQESADIVATVLKVRQALMDDVWFSVMSVPKSAIALAKRGVSLALLQADR